VTVRATSATPRSPRLVAEAAGVLHPLVVYEDDSSAERAAPSDQHLLDER
jgi:hypothetical protein